MSAEDKVSIEKIDRIYFCKECQMVFLFKSDVKEHQDRHGHSNLKDMPF